MSTVMYPTGGEMQSAAHALDWPTASQPSIPVARPAPASGSNFHWERSGYCQGQQLSRQGHGARGGVGCEDQRRPAAADGTAPAGRPTWGRRRAIYSRGGGGPADPYRPVRVGPARHVSGRREPPRPDRRGGHGHQLRTGRPPVMTAGGMERSRPGPAAATTHKLLAVTTAAHSTPNHQNLSERVLMPGLFWEVDNDICHIHYPLDSL